METKRLTLFAGHYGSGKTNVALNYAFNLRKQGYDTVIADIDTVNPYFRTKDSAKELEEAGIDLIASEFAGSNVDLPALPAAMYDIIFQSNKHAVIDILREIEAASGIPVNGLVNNSNLGPSTDIEALKASLAYAKKVSELSGLPIVATGCPDSDQFNSFSGFGSEYGEILKLKLQKIYCSY